MSIYLNIINFYLLFYYYHIIYSYHFQRQKPKNKNVKRKMTNENLRMEKILALGFLTFNF